MKRLILGGLSVLLLTAAPATLAQTEAYNAATQQSTFNKQLTPFDLVTLAHRGYFQAQGIPSYTNFSSAYYLGKLTAKDLVQAAVSANQIQASTLTDWSLD